MTTPQAQQLDYHALNAMLNLYDADGKIQFDKDREAARQFFLQHVNQNTVYFHSLEEKINYLIENDYYEKDFLDQYDFSFVKSLYKRAYDKKFRFPTFMSAYKYYTSYTLKTFDGKRYLERYEDRVVAVALYLARGDEKQAINLVDEIMAGRFQPATPTFLNAGKAQRGDLVSCFLLKVSDNMESIARAINSSLQLSKRGGGVALLLTDIREQGAPIKKIENQSSGIVPVMKLLEDSFSYANQLGARQGAGAVYLSAHHPDIMTFLDTKRENADEKIRIKTLSLGVVIPDITLELARRNEDMYLFSPYDVQRVYGVPMSEISITEKYQEMVENPEIRKKKIKARDFFLTLAEVQVQSGYPYILFEDNANKSHALPGRINMSNLCVTGDTEILTANGYRKVSDLYQSQEDFNVVVDLRARDMDLSTPGTSVEKSTRMFKTAEQAEIFKVTTAEGYELRATEWHKMYVERDGDLVKIPLNEVEPGDKILVQSGKGAWGDIHKPELAYVAGALAADGTITESQTSAGNYTSTARITLYGHKREFAPALETAVAKALVGREDLVERQSTLEPEFTYSAVYDRSTLHSAPLAKLLAEHGVTQATRTTVPEFVKRGDYETQRAYISGYFQLEGTVTGSASNGSTTIEAVSVNRAHLVELQKMLLNMGVFTRIYKQRTETTTAVFPDGKEYNQQPTWSLRATTREDVDALYELVDWSTKHEARYNALVATRQEGRAPYRTHKHRATVLSIEPDGIEDVYDVTVENGHSVIFNGIATGQCSEILQVNSDSEFNVDSTYKVVGRDISCNLGSMNIAKAMDGGDLGKTVEIAIRALTAVSDASNIEAVPSIVEGNKKSHAIGLGQMNLHGYLARERIHYGSEEALDFTNMYFYTVTYHAIKASNKIAKERGETFYEFEKSKYATGEYFTKYIEKEWAPKTDKVAKLFAEAGIEIPTQDDWRRLKNSVQKYGMYNAYLQAVPPTGSIAYLSHSTASIHPVTSLVEIRKEGSVGRVYVPAPYLTDDNKEYFEDAYQIGYKKIIDTYAVATQHVDQGLSCTLFFNEGATTRDLNKAQIYAWRKGLKTLYYVRMRKLAIEGTDMEGCVSCAL